MVACVSFDKEYEVSAVWKMDCEAKYTDIYMYMPSTGYELNFWSGVYGTIIGECKLFLIQTSL